MFDRVTVRATRRFDDDVVFLLPLHGALLTGKLALKHVSLPTVEGMIMPFLVVLAAVETNVGHVDDFLQFPSTSSLERDEVHVDEFLSFPSTAVETNVMHLHGFLLPPQTAVKDERCAC